jgi:hypothetical protein
LWLGILLLIGAYVYFKGKSVDFLPGDAQSGAAAMTVDENKVTALANAIADAEGFGVPGAIPTVNHNPGDITDGKGNKLVYASDADGMAALSSIVRGWLTGVSRLYSLDDSFQEVGRKYVNGPNAGVDANSMAWASNVVAWLNRNAGVSLSPASTLRDFLNWTAPAPVYGCEGATLPSSPGCCGSSSGGCFAC